MGLLLTQLDGAPEAITGTGAIAFAVVALDATGLETFTGTGDETFAGPALAATALETFTGTGAVAFAVASLEATGEEVFTSTAAVVFSGPALEGTGTTEVADITGSGDLTIQAPELTGVGIGGVEAESGVVGVLGWRRMPQQAAPSPITGTGAMRLQAPHMVANGVLAMSGIGTKSIGVVRIAGEGGQRILGIAEMAQRVAVAGTGTVFTRRVVRTDAVHPARTIEGVGSYTLRGDSLSGIAVVELPPRDAVDREWTALQQQAEDDEALCLLGVLDA